MNHNQVGIIIKKKHFKFISFKMRILPANTFRSEFGGCDDVRATPQLVGDQWTYWWNSRSEVMWPLESVFQKVRKTATEHSLDLFKFSLEQRQMECRNMFESG